MKPQDLNAVLSFLIANVETMASILDTKAKLCREYYRALIEQGFSKSEALEICKHFKVGDL